MDVDFVRMGCGVLYSKIIRKRKAFLGSDKKRDPFESSHESLLSPPRFDSYIALISLFF